MTIIMSPASFYEIVTIIRFNGRRFAAFLLSQRSYPVYGRAQDVVCLAVCLSECGLDGAGTANKPRGCAPSSSLLIWSPSFPAPSLRPARVPSSPPAPCLPAREAVINIRSYQTACDKRVVKNSSAIKHGNNIIILLSAFKYYVDCWTFYF